MAKKKSSRKIPKVRIVKPSGRPYQIRYKCPVEEREIRISVGSRDMEDAENLKAEVEARLTLNLDVKRKSEKVLGPEMDWKDFREEYRVLHLATVRDKTAADAESRLDISEKIIKPKKLGDMAEPATLQKLRSRLLTGDHSRRKKPRSPHTVRGYMKSVIAALNWAYLQDWLSQPPKVPKMKVSKQKAMKGRPITEDEFKLMLKAVPEVVGKEVTSSWQYLLRGLWESALRIDELMHVSWDKQGTIRPIWGQGELPVLEILASMQKNDTHETIPILPGFEALLRETPESDREGWVFNPESLQSRIGRKKKHERPNADWVGRIISRIGKKAKIKVDEADERTGRPEKYASAHDLRRSCGERLRNAGVPPLVICRVMRHSSWETTRRHYAPGDIQSDAAVLRKILDSEGTAD